MECMDVCTLCRHTHLLVTCQLRSIDSSSTYIEYVTYCPDAPICSVCDGSMTPIEPRSRVVVSVHTVGL